MSILSFLLGHNTDGKYFITSNRMDFMTENTPRVITVYVEKARDGTVTPLHDVDAREIACGTNHTVGSVYWTDP